ncbi:NADP-dependent oxidoreductase [Hamadaea tsunoensis]|uniref:NADP-dependent oxidoreductase n=1 Tax=Hamadaea tsunoensis TaxID=53368 RepID=UPI000405A08A|nr:NADP-dependent oxidoreductase [Hamadaea tsunoensis]
MLSREIHLAARPNGWPTPADFRLVETDVPEPGPGEVRVRNLYMSVDPYMRGRMNDVKSYVPPFELDRPMDGGAVGEVVDSAAPGLSPGDFVLHGFGFRDLVTAPADRFRKVDPALGLTHYLGALGMPGLTAYAGLLEVGEFRPGDAVFVSGAAGAVGSLVGQFARLKGASRVIGSAGTPAKVRHLTERLGFDEAFDYKAAPVAESLKKAAPDGIDVYFDNVGGDHLEAAISRLRLRGRVVLCGAISAYNEDQPGPRNLALAIGKRLTLRGMIVNDHSALMPDFLAEAGSWLADGRLIAEETVVEGLQNAPAALIDLMRGANTGKMLVAL